MTTKVDVVMRAFKDDRYRDLLLSNPDKALSGLGLSRDDDYALRQLDRKSFDSAATRLDQDLYNRLRRGDVENPSVSEKAGIWDAVED